MTDADQPVMSTWEAIESKRVIRDFADRPLEPDHLVRILNAGRRAASSKNLSAGTSSSVATATTSPSSPPSGRGPTTSRAPPWRSRS